jgi:hypothetical protein
LNLAGYNYLSPSTEQLKFDTISPNFQNFRAARSIKSTT